MLASPQRIHRLAMSVFELSPASLNPRSSSAAIANHQNACDTALMLRERSASSVDTTTHGRPATANIVSAAPAPSGFHQQLI